MLRSTEAEEQRARGCSCLVGLEFPRYAPTQVDMTALVSGYRWLELDGGLGMEMLHL